MGHRIYFIFGSHQHIPWGAGDEEFEDLYYQKLKPLSTALYKFPRISMVFHYSGVLLQWLERRHSEFILLLRDLITRRQVELLGGGFYEPLLPLLPMPDKIGQIEMFTAYLRRQFGKRPQGCWLPGLAWEQSLASPLNTCGMAYTFLDERAFVAAGGEGPGQTYSSPCITEDQGKIVTVFPLSYRIEESLAREPFSAVLDSLATELPAEEERIVTVFPDRLRGEGMESSELFYHRLFEELSGFENRFEFTLPGKVFRSLRGPGKLYFPSSIGRGAAYSNLPRRGLTLCPEVKGIYGKMMFTHSLINQLRGDKARKLTARQELWKAQGGDLFSTPSDAAGSAGPFPREQLPREKLPLYRHSLRKAVYRALLEAEKISRGKGNFSPSLSSFDFDFDGQGEYLFQGEILNCYIRSEGAALFELDYLPRSWNYLDTLAGCPDTLQGCPDTLQGCPDTLQGYPDTFAGCPGERRTAFADYLLPPADAVDQAPPEGGGPAFRFCGAERFETAEMDRVKGTVRFRLPPRMELPFGGIEIDKTYYLKKDALVVEYLLHNRGTEPLEFILSPRLDLSFAGEGEEFLVLEKRPADPLRGEGKLLAEDKFAGGLSEGAEVLEFQDLKNETLVSFQANRPFTCRIFPVYAGGNDSAAYQSTCVLPLFPAGLGAGESWGATFLLRCSAQG